MPTNDIPRDWRCPPNWPSPDQAKAMRAEREMWDKIIAATPPANPPHDIEKLIKERPELFDYQDVPDLANEDERYVADMAKLQPQWMKDELAKVERHAEPAAKPHLE